MSTWTEQVTSSAAPAAVLAVLTDPTACGRWAPVAFEVHALEGPRLRPGSQARVAGRLAGRQVGFAVDVLDADEGRLALVAHGPIAFDVEYRLRPAGTGSEVRATIGVSGRGLAGRLLAEAAGALLAGGGLRSALAALAREAEALPAARAGRKTGPAPRQRTKRPAGAATSTRSRPLALAA